MAKKIWRIYNFLLYTRYASIITKERRIKCVWIMTSANAVFHRLRNLAAERLLCVLAGVRAYYCLLTAHFLLFAVSSLLFNAHWQKVVKSEVSSSHESACLHYFGRTFITNSAKLCDRMRRSGLKSAKKWPGITTNKCVHRRLLIGLVDWLRWHFEYWGELLSTSEKQVNDIWHFQVSQYVWHETLVLKILEVEING